ncbi:hypothetical protein FWC31_01250 [Candidatus Saccharibacteria bacterium]|nr:hypothetical protein [Candidatus Saccharibacteria bacterium]
MSVDNPRIRAYIQQSPILNQLRRTREYPSDSSLRREKELAQQVLEILGECGGAMQICNLSPTEFQNMAELFRLRVATGPSWSGKTGKRLPPDLKTSAGIAVPYPHRRSAFQHCGPRYENPGGPHLYGSIGDLMSNNADRTQSQPLLGQANAGIVEPWRLVNSESAGMYPISMMYGLYAMQWPIRFEGTKSQRKIIGYMMSQPAIRTRISFTPYDENRSGMLQVAGLYNFQQLTPDQQEQIAEDCDRAATNVRQLEKLRPNFTLPDTRHLMMNTVIEMMSQREDDNRLVKPVDATDYSLGVDVLAQPLKYLTEDAEYGFPGWLAPYYDISGVPRLMLPKDEPKKWRKHKMIHAWGDHYLSRFKVVSDGDNVSSRLEEIKPKK